MKRTMITIGAVLYLAACWAPQLWTGTADAQEKPEEPAVLEEVRARRFVLVDAEGKTIAEFDDRHGGALLVMRGSNENKVSLGLLGGITPVIGLSEGQQDSLTCAASGITLGADDGASAHYGTWGLTLAKDGQPRAEVGCIETVNESTGAKTATDGTFVSYDADGNVLWMEPR